MTRWGDEGRTARRVALNRVKELLRNPLKQHSRPGDCRLHPPRFLERLEIRAVVEEGEFAPL